MFLKKVLMQLLELASEFELKDVDGNYEESEVCETSYLW